MKVITWKLKDRRSSSFTINLSQSQKSHQERRYVIDVGENTLLYVERMYDPRQFDRDYSGHQESSPDFMIENIYFKRVRLGGQIVAEGMLKFPRARNSDALSGVWTRGMDANGNLWVFEDRIIDSEIGVPPKNEYEVQQIFYNFEDDRLDSRVQSKLLSCDTE